MTDEIQHAFVKLYHPTGALVTIPIDPLNRFSPERASDLLYSVDALLTAGFQVNLPGLEQGELVEEMSHIARREGADQTPIVDFYSSNLRLEKKLLHIYMNTADDIAAFEAATGIKLGDLPVYEGKTAIERKDRHAAKYIRALSRPIKIVFKINPRWEQWNQAGKEGLEPHKRLIVRYEVDRKPEAEQKPASEILASEPQGAQYKKLSGELVQMLVKETGQKPNVITPILSKIASDTISFESALKLVKSNITQESV